VNNVIEYSIGEFAERINLSIPTLRNMDKDGRLVPYRISNGGHRIYNEEQALDYIRQTLSDKYKSNKQNIIGYFRSSDSETNSDKKNLLTKYIHDKGLHAEIIIEKETYYKYSLLKDIVYRVLNGDIKEIVITEETDIFKEVKDIFEQILEVNKCKLIVL